MLISTLIIGFLFGLMSPSYAQNNDEHLVGAVIVQPKDALPKKVKEPIKPTEESDQLVNEIADLKNLLIGQLPKTLSIEALFEVDLQDEIVVAQRITSLNERLNSDKLATPDLTVANDIRYLRLERDRLRLAFLSLPQEQRKAILEQNRLNQRSKDLASEQKTSAKELASSEQARDTALSAANLATDEVVRELATEEARLLAHLSEIASLRQSWVSKNQQLLDQHKEVLARYAVSNTEKQLDAKQADALYEQIRIDLKNERDSASLALDALNAPFSIRELQSTLNMTNSKYAAHADTLDRIRTLRGKITVEEANLQVRESRERYAHANEIMHTLSTLQAKRVSLLPLLSIEKRSQATSLFGDGLQRILSEVSHVQLMVRWYPIKRTQEAKSFASLLKNVFEAGKFGAEILGLMLLAVFLYVCLARSRRWLHNLRVWFSGNIKNHLVMRRIDNLMQLLIRISNELVILLTVYILFDQILQSRLGITEIAVARTLAYAYAFYTLTLAFIHRILLVAVSRYRVVEPSLNEKILHSLRLIARVTLFFVVYLIIAKAMLGEGALYGIAKNIAVMVSLIVAWRLMSEWREEVTQAYLNIYKEGRLADMVRAGTGRSYGLLIASAAFLFVAARGILVWLRDGALSFEQTRKALAYLFRRQLERQSKNQTSPTEAIVLPEALTAALTEDAAFDNLCIDHYPQMQEVETTALELLKLKHGMLIAVKGERGAGKTTWLRELERRLQNTIPCTFHSIDRRVTEESEICILLSQVLGMEETSDPQVIIDTLMSKCPQVVLIDLGQNLMLRDVGGLAAYELFIKIAQATSTKIVWVVSFARWAFEYLDRTQPGRDIYDKTIELKPWSEKMIANLLETRLMISGFTAEYDQLLLNAAPQPSINIAKSGSSDSMDTVDAVEKIADRYYRLIWDYADGNPRVALHFFRLSLSHVSENRVTVHLFPLPSMNELETFERRTHYLLACLVQHENLSIAEAAKSLRFPESECARAMQLLERDGFVTITEGNTYRVTSHWNRAVLRFLQRKKLLAI